MASFSGSVSNNLTVLDRLIQQRKDVTAAREKENQARADVQKSSDRLFEQSQTFKVARFEAAEALHFARERANQEAVLVQLRARHERELAKLRRRQTKEITFHDVETEKMLKKIQESTDALVGELLWDLDAEAKARSLERQREEEALQTKRLNEDNLLKDTLLKTVDQENVRTTRLRQDPETGHQEFINRRAPHKASPNISEADQEVLRGVKRQKLDHDPRVALPKAPTSPSSTLPSEDTKDVARVLSTLPEFLGNELPGKAVQTCFELRYIGGCLDYYNDTDTTWSAVPGQPNRTIRANPNKKIFEPYDGEFRESIQQPMWVLDGVGAEVFYDRASARIYSWKVIEGIGRGLGLEFKDSKEFDAFMALLKEYYEGRYIGCTPWEGLIHRW